MHYMPLNHENFLPRHQFYEVKKIFDFFKKKYLC